MQQYLNVTLRRPCSCYGGVSLKRKAISQRFISVMLTTALWLQSGCDHKLANNEGSPCGAQRGEWQLLGLEKETVTAIALHPQDPSIIYAGTQFDFSAGRDGKLFKSTDCGTTWDTLIVGGSYRAIVLNPSNPEIVYAVPGSLIKSMNGGRTWRVAMNGMRLSLEQRVQCLAIDPKNPNVLYAGVGGFGTGTLYKSTDEGENWTDLEQDDFFLFDGVVSLAIDPSNTNIVYAGTDDRGRLLQTTDGGKTWNETGLGETGLIIDVLALSPGNSRIVFAGVRFEGFFRSVDGGVNWSGLESNFPDTTFSTRALLFDHTNSEKMYVTILREAYSSRDGGKTWTELSNDPQKNALQVLAIDRSGAYVYGSSLENGIHMFRIK